MTRKPPFVAVAGRKGAVTVATNMAGRGTDIMLGGNVEFLADAELKSEGYSPDDTPDEYEKRWPGTLAEIKDQVKDEHERSSSSAVCTCLVPSATNPAVSTTSCAAVPAVRAIRVNPVSTCRSKTI